MGYGGEIDLLKISFEILHNQMKIGEFTGQEAVSWCLEGTSKLEIIKLRFTMNEGEPSPKHPSIKTEMDRIKFTLIHTIVAKNEKAAKNLRYDFFSDCCLQIGIPIVMTSRSISDVFRNSESLLFSIFCSTKDTLNHENQSFLFLSQNNPVPNFLLFQKNDEAHQTNVLGFDTNTVYRFTTG